MNPWHDINYGEKSPEIVNAIIEIPKGSKGKFEIDKGSGLIKLDRVLFSSVHYPANYGFIPQTYCDDKDPLDILVITSIELPPLCLIEAKVIGVMRMVDQGEADDKIIAVLKDDLLYSKYKDISELPESVVNRLQHYFLTYKNLPGEPMTCEIANVYGREEAHQVIRHSVTDYLNNFGML